MALKILYVINSLGAGGAERSTLELARYMRDCGHAVTVAYFRQKGVGVAAEVAELGIAQVELPAGGWQRFRHLIRWVRHHRPDLVHSVLYEANLLTRLSSALFPPRVVRVESLVSTPYVAARQQDRSIRGLKLAVVKFLDGLSARFFRAHYHAISATVWAHYRPLYGKSPVSVIYRGRADTGLPHVTPDRSPFRFLHVGRHDFQKGQITLIRAVGILCQQGITDFEVHMAGREGSQTPLLMNEVRQLGIHQKVVFHPYRKDIPEWLGSGNAFVFPSVLEGLGGALLEAMAAGLPCIVSDIPTFREVIGDSENALFFRSGDAFELAACMARLYRDADQCVRLGSAVRQRFEQAFQLEQVSRQMEQMYDELVNR